LLAFRTIFVPKKGNPTEAENYRPISIASVITRHFNRVLAVRLEGLSAVDVRQRAFRRTDGVAENLFLLSSLLRDARQRYRGLCLASLDLSKAFDSVSHDAIYCAMRRVGLSASFVAFVERMYRNSGTFIQGGQQCSRALMVQKGVRQGDPLSPLLFNLVVDLGLEAIPDAVGYSIGQWRVSALAFADDVILVAETPSGLQAALTAFVDKLGEAGMRLNQTKSATITLVPAGKVNKVKVTDTVYHFGGVPLPVLAITSLWRYLGLDFVGSKDQEWSCATFTASIERITKAQMKSQM
jgi:hypothetical protein